MKLDSGYRCEKCDSKQVDLYETVSPRGEHDDKILCFPHALDLDEKPGWTVDQALTPRQIRDEAKWRAAGISTR